MKRNEKIKLLQAIKEGKICPADLDEKQVLVFYRRSEGWEHEGRILTNDEYDEIKLRYDKRNRSRTAAGLEEDVFITVTYDHKSTEPFNTTLNID